MRKMDDTYQRPNKRKPTTKTTGDCSATTARGCPRPGRPPWSPRLLPSRSTSRTLHLCPPYNVLYNSSITSSRRSEPRSTAWELSLSSVPSSVLCMQRDCCVKPLQTVSDSVHYCFCNTSTASKTSHPRRRLSSLRCVLQYDSPCLRHTHAHHAEERAPPGRQTALTCCPTSQPCVRAFPQAAGFVHLPRAGRKTIPPPRESPLIAKLESGPNQQKDYDRTQNPKT